MMISQKFKDAKVGDFFYESPTRYYLPRIVEFLGFNAKGQVEFKVIQTGEIFEINSDDRYGYYPPLTESVKQKIRNRISKLKAELETYEYLENQF